MKRNALLLFGTSADFWKGTYLGCFVSKMGIPYYCFHDTDLVDEGNLFSDFEKNVSMIDQ